MNAFWAQVIAAMVGAITTGGVKYLTTYLPRRRVGRVDAADTDDVGVTAQDSALE